MLYIKKYENIEDANESIAYAPFVGCVKGNCYNAVYGKINGYSKTDKIEKHTLSNNKKFIRIDRSYVNLDLENNNIASKDRVYFSTNIIDEEFFKGREDIVKIEFGEEITTINGSAFSGCSNLTSITIPPSVSSIKSGAFNGCGNLSDITINSNALTSQNYVSNGGEGLYRLIFGECPNITGITFGNNVTYINYGFFPGCESLIEVTGNNVKTLGRANFYGCTNLKKCYFPMLTEAGYECFEACANVETFEAESLETVGYSSFGKMGNTSSDGIKLGYFPRLITVGEHAFSDSGFVEIYAPKVSSLASQNTFYKMTKLKKITLGKINCIPEQMFRECRQLTDITINITKEQFIKYNPASKTYWSHQIPSTCVIHFIDCDLQLTANSPYRNGG